MKFEDFYHCLFGGEYRKEDDYFRIRSLSLDIHFQKVLKTALYPFDERRC